MSKALWLPLAIIACTIGVIAAYDRARRAPDELRAFTWAIFCLCAALGVVLCLALGIAR